MGFPEKPHVSGSGNGGDTVPRRPFVVRAYGWGLQLFPAAIRRADSQEMLETFADLWEEEVGHVARFGLLLRSFGGLLWVAGLEWKDEWRGSGATAPERRTRRWGMSAWTGSLRYALRTLRKSPSFTLTTIVLLALGVGSATTIFTLVDHVLLRSLPYPSVERLFLVENGAHSGPMVREFQTMNAVDRWGIALMRTANLHGGPDPVRINQSEVSRGFFSLFGATPGVGRLLVDEDYAAPDVAVLSHGTWQRVFGGDPDVVGRTIRVDEAPFTVVGVMAESFVAPEAINSRGNITDVWIPLDLTREEFERVGYHVLDVIGRIAPGATLADVDAEMRRVNDRLAAMYPDHFIDDEGNYDYTPVAGLFEVTTRPVRAGLGLLLGAVGLLLLVACINVAHLFLARGLGRVQEMSIRRALGAETTSLVQQLMVESLVLGLAGGLLGLGLASFGLRSFMALNPHFIPRTGAVALDLRIMAFAAVVSVVTVLLFGLIPALRSVGKDLTAGVRSTSRGATHSRSTARMRNALVVAEVALSLILVTAAGLLLRSFVRVQARDPGFRTAGVWTVPLTPTWINSPEEYVRVMDRVEASLAAIPGVSRATYSFTMPFEMTGRGRCCWMTSQLSADGSEREGLRLILQPVTETYFETLGVRLSAGRVWRASEAMLVPWPVVLSENLAVGAFGSSERAIGRTMEVGGDGTPVRVVGVAEDTRHFGLDQDPPLFIYLPMERVPFDLDLAHLAVFIDRDPPAGWARTLRESIWRAIPDVPVPTIRSMAEWQELSTAGRRFDSVLFGTFGALALVMAAAGLFGTLLYSVGQQRRELGIRLALGAVRASLERRVVFTGLSLGLMGSVAGLGGVWATGRFLESRLYDLEPTDPVTLFASVVILLTVAALASWLPARRAGRTDPLETLKAE